MKRLILGALLFPLVCLGALMFVSPLRLFDLVVPSDPGTLAVAAGLSYGSEPRQKLDIYAPAPVRRHLPILIFCYGGAWSTGDRGAYGFVGRAFAARGYMTVVFDYRLVPSALYPAFVEDTAAAVAWAYLHGADYGGDPSRIFLVGHSAGAYNVAMAALEARFLGRFGLSPDVIAGVATLAGPFDFLPLDDASAVAAFGAWPDLPDTQPVNHVSAGAPPFLLLTGTDDKTVYPRNSEELQRRLSGANVPAELKYYDGIGHAALMLALARPLRWRAPVLDDVVAFFSGLRTDPSARPSLHRNGR